jgi:hypothetical protein
VIIPFIIFFKIFTISSEIGNKYKYDFDFYLNNIYNLWNYFSSRELIYAAIIIKIILLINFKKIFKRNLSHVSYFSLLLTVIFIVYSFSISKISNYLFVRYFIPLQPLLSIILISDCYLLIILIKNYAIKYSKVYLRIFYSFLIISGIINFRNNFDDFSGLIYQSTHQYKGCLDYVIPYIKDNYLNTDSLIIATNYEECSYMFFLIQKQLLDLLEIT